MLLSEISSYDDSELQSFADVTSEPGVPAATRLDRLLVRATEAALDTTDSSHCQHRQQVRPAECASNANNRGASNRHQLAGNAAEKSSSGSGSGNSINDNGKQQQQQQQKKTKKKTTMNLTQRMLSLFGFSRGGGGSGNSSDAKPSESNRSNRQVSKQAGGKNSSKKAAASSAAILGNASNVEIGTGGKDEGEGESAVAEAAPPPAETSEAEEPPSQQPPTPASADRTTNEQAPPSSQQPQKPPQQQQQKQPKPQQKQKGDNTLATATSPGAEGQQTPTDGGPRRFVLRGGPTTASHKRVQEAIFRECRIVPIATMYKKVAMVPGRERVFFSAASNPRTNGSRLLYDIAYENYRHHSDCNRDFARVGLKKICPNYCRPSQFRYVY